MRGKLSTLAIALLVALLPLAHAGYAYDPEHDQRTTWNGTAAALLGGVECEHGASDLTFFAADHSYDGSRIVAHFAVRSVDEPMRCSSGLFRGDDSTLAAALFPPETTGVRFLSVHAPVLGPAEEQTTVRIVLLSGDQVVVPASVYRNGTYVRIDIPVSGAAGDASFDVTGAPMVAMPRAGSFVRAPITGSWLGTVHDSMDDVQIHGS